MKHVRYVLFAVVLTLLASSAGAISLLGRSAPTQTLTTLSATASPAAEPLPPRIVRAPRATRSRPSPKPTPVIHKQTHKKTTKTTTRRTTSHTYGTGIWDRLAQCESTGRWDYNGSSGYDGGLQFAPSTWTRKKFPGYPAYAWQATRDQQIAVAIKVQRESGWGQWPACAKKLGLI